MRSLLFSRLRSNHRLLLSRIASIAISQSPSPLPPPSPPIRYLYGFPSDTEGARLDQPNTSSGMLQWDSPQPEDEEDGPMNEFLSRFVWAIRPKLADAYPDLPRKTLDAMLLLVCQKVVALMEPGAATAEDTPVDLSEDLWKTVVEVSNSVHEAMRRDRLREELKEYLHCEEVKQMCRFAGDIGIRGPMLRELRFKWTREKLEEVEFNRRLDRMREQGEQKEKLEKGVFLAAGNDAGRAVDEKGATSKVLALPQRKGKINYKIYGLDLSGHEWEEVVRKAEEAQKHFVPEELQPVEGKCKKVEEKILSLNAKRDDPKPLLEEWKELLNPKRVDWLALLDRIKERNVNLHLEIAELLLTEESFGSNVRDYSKLIEAHSNADRIEDAERILQMMIERGIMPDAIVLLILVRMYSKVGNLDRAKEAFESLRREGFQPDLKAYSLMITTYLKAGLTKEGETLMKEMEARGIKPTKEIYMDLLRAYTERDQIAGAQRIMNTMQFAGILPTLESFTLLVEVYGKAGDTDQAWGYFDHMMKSGHKPDDRCTASMMAAYSRKNFLDKALNLLLTLEEDGFQPGIATHSVLVDWLGRLQLVEEAEAMLRKITEKGEVPLEVHVSLCDMYSRARQQAKARKSLKILEARKELLQADQFERIISGLLDGGLLEDGKRMYERMQAKGFKPSEHIMVAISAQQVPRQWPSIRRGGRS